jgi:hypothetical protein
MNRNAVVLVTFYHAPKTDRHSMKKIALVDVIRVKNSAHQTILSIMKIANAIVT